jgi:L-seryl-tRNA(Ser) seleniumtransferase
VTKAAGGCILAPLHMNRIRTRRDFFQWSRGLLAAGGLAGQALPLRSAPAPNDPAEDGEDYYDKLGVTKIINAAGTYTILTASTMPPSVQAAVARAAKHPVRLIQLQKAAGEYLAGKLHCEAAMVTAGAASALTLGTAACMTVANQSASHAIPTDMAGLKNEVIVQKAHRYGYDHALRNCGIRFVEVETPAEYDSAFTGQTVMAHFFNAAEAGQIGREEWIRVAHKHGVPCFNDAAADVPPISNLWNYTRMGFDLVTFSGGKGIRGPQNAGLLLGRKDLIAAAVANNSPFDDCVGRGMKVAKEQIVGMVAAVDWFLSQTDEGMDAEFRRRANRIAAQLKDIPTLSHEIHVPPVANHIPH